VPSPKKQGHTALLVQIPDDVHAAADRRRRAENITWARLVTELLRRWVAGDEADLAAPVRHPRPVGPDAEEAERLHQKWMAEDPKYARACTEKVDPSNLPRYRSLGELFAADAAKAGRTLPPNVVAAIDADQDDEVEQ